MESHEYFPDGEVTTVRVVVPPEAILISGSLPDLIEQAEHLKVVDASGEAAAAALLGEIKSRYARLDEERKAMTRPLDEAKKRAMDLFRRPLEALQAAESKLKSSVAVYREEMHRRAEEARKRAEEAARKERERLAREAAALEERARRERAAAEERARELEGEGRLERARAVHEAALQREAERLQAAEAKRLEAEATTPVAIVAPPKTDGLSARETWSVEVVDLIALIRAVAAGEQPATFLQANEKALNQVARALKQEMQVPGVRPVKETTIASRRSR